MTAPINAPFAGRPPGLVEHQLPNGATIAVLPTGSDAVGRGPASGSVGGVVALQLWVLAGTAAERTAEHGCAHLLEHMLFKPVELPGAGGSTDIATDIEALGGDVNAFTSHDETVFHATVPAAAAVAGIDALLPGIVAPTIEADALAREAEVVVEEILQYRDDPASRLQQDVMEDLFGEHAYGRPVLGTEDDVRSCTAARLQRFHARAYGADQVYFIVVGAVAAKAVIKAATPWLLRLPPARRRKALPNSVPATRAAVRVRRSDVLEAHLELGWSAPSLPEPEAVALEVAAVILGYGEAARLSVQTRRIDQLVSDAHSSFYGSRLGSTFMVTARMRAKQATAATTAIVAQIVALRDGLIDDEELARAKAVLRSDLVYRRETTQGQAHALGYTLSLAGDLEADRRYYQRLSEVTPAAVRRACLTWLDPRVATLGIVVPQKQLSAKQGVALRKNIAAALKPAAQRSGRAAPRKIRNKGGVQWVDLPSGIRLRAVVDKRVPIAGGWLVWPGGLRLEDKRRHGQTPLMAELLTRGCEAVDGDTLARQIDGLAAVLDGFSGRSSAGLHLECMAADLPTVLRRALQCATAPSFDAYELDEERRVALADFEAEDDDLGKVAVRDVMQRLYAGHPFRFRRRGTPETLARQTSATLRKAWAQRYPVSRMVIGLAGDVDLDAVAALVESEVAAAADGDVATRWPQWPRATLKMPAASGRAQVIRRAKEQAHIALAYRGLKIGDPRSPALEVLTAVLGGQSGRLFMRLREEEGLVYHVGASASEGIDAGDVLVYAATGQDKVERARAAIETQLDAVASDGITVEELARARAWLAGQYDAGLERRGRLASVVAFDEAFGLPIGNGFRYTQRIGRVTRRAVRDIARALLATEHQISTIVSA